MSFTITREKDEDLDLLQITDLTSGIQVRILPDTGALLQEFSIPAGNRRIMVIEGYRNQDDLRKNHLLSYRSAKLSPFVCRIAGGRYVFEGKNYEFKNKFPDGTAIHGLVADKPFSVKEKDIQSDQASVLLQYEYREDDPAYPFTYSIEVKYTLKRKGRLELTTRVTNLSGFRIPIADGWHPYFRLEGVTDQWLLKLRSKKMVVFDDRLIPTGKLADDTRFNTARTIGQEFFDHCFLLNDDFQQPAAVLQNPENGLRLSLYPDKTYPYVQVYTPPGRRSIALENLSAAPDAFNNTMGLIHLGPGASQSFSVLYLLEFT